MAGSSWKWWVTGAIVAPLFVLGYDRVQGRVWVGRTDLEVRFVVTDAATGAPVAGARIEIQQAKGGYSDDNEEKEFDLVSGGDGLAKRECPGTRAVGARGGMGLSDTFAAYPPSWRFRVSAEGYEPREWTELDTPKNCERARRTTPGKSELVVPAPLQKRRARSSAAHQAGPANRLNVDAP